MCCAFFLCSFSVFVCIYLFLFLSVLQNPQEDKYQTLKLRNAVVGKMLAVTGFLDVLSFGPGGFRLTSDGLCLQSRWKRLLDRLPGHMRRRDLLRWLQKYMDFCSELLLIQVPSGE